jgi:hypothetical protein
VITRFAVASVNPDFLANESVSVLAIVHETLRSDPDIRASRNCSVDFGK